MGDDVLIAKCVTRALRLPYEGLTRAFRTKSLLSASNPQQEIVGESSYEELRPMRWKAGTGCPRP